MDIVGVAIPCDPHRDMSYVACAGSQVDINAGDGIVAHFAFRSVVGLCCLCEGLLGDLLTLALEGHLHIRVQIRVGSGIVLTLESIVVLLRNSRWWTVKDNQEESCEPSHASEYKDPHDESKNQRQRPTTSLLGRLSIEWWLLSPLWLSIG